MKSDSAPPDGEELVLDLEEPAESIRSGIVSALSEFSQSRGVPALMLLHVNAAHGQLQIHFRPRENITDADYLPAAVLEFPVWEQASRWSYDRSDGLIVQMPDGTDALPEDCHQFSYLMGAYVCSLVRTAVGGLPEGSLPRQIMVETESGEFQEEWQP